MRTLVAHRGYTVIEMVVVLALMGILLTLGAASFRGALAREEADGWVRSIVYDIAAGQQAAITRRAYVIATFLPATFLPATFLPSTYAITVSGGGILRQDTLPSHMTFGSTTSVTFNRRGIPSAGLTMVVSSTSGRSFTITVEAGTGRVSYSEP